MYFSGMCLIEVHMYMYNIHVSCSFVYTVGQLVAGRGIWAWHSVGTVAAHIPAGQGFTEPHCMEL